MLLNYMIYVLAIIFHFPRAYSNGLLRKDYYESLSNPTQCLVVLHYHTTGPLLLFVSFIYRVYISKHFDESKKYDKEIYFKKIDRKCNNTVIFSTMFENFTKFELDILLFLYEYKEFIGQIHYKFNKNFTNGRYELWDMNKHFSVHVEVFNDLKEYFATSPYSINEVKSYINSIVEKPEDLCLITFNNNAVVVTPKYEHSKIDGLIIRFVAEFFDNGVRVGKYYISAFECKKTQTYPDESIIFIIDKPKLDVKFMAVTMKFSGEEKIETTYQFQLPKFLFEYVDNLEFVPRIYNQVFLINLKIKNIPCEDGTERKLFQSNNGIPFYAIESKKIYVKPYLKKLININHPLVDKC